ncbi:Mannosyl-oligosaccharide alpha-1,2-mannosidase [Phytophthora palmivora]|uniref:alpha-1,2-Mannosidase n=1 Tax=Phytophthora palmivora TaxID=4796 RepID=A0A2P4Y2B5_9STRA|nr:Mannosyl-oligosaccharide alpha-1,2-mannosidase [Phytophthora palmivora]
MNHLRRIEHETEDTPAPAVETFEFEPPASDPTHEEEQQRRAPYDPSMHNEDQKQVVDMVQWAWKGYSEYAYGHDSLNVKTYKGTGLPDHDMALTLVDALDTLYLVGMFDEFDRASEWVANNMEQRIFLSGFISFFETTIRLMGGLLSSYYMSGHVHLLTIANKLGMALSPAFDVYEHGIPDKDFDIVTKRTRAAPSLAEVGTLQMEFKYLARLTRYSKYQEQVDRISDSHTGKITTSKITMGANPVQVNQHTGKITTSKITMGANGDSYYEYLLKQWLLSDKKDEKFKTQYMTAVDGIMDKLLGKSKPNGFVFIGELVYGKFEPKMDHLVCFVPGMLALGYQNGMPEEHLTLAKQLMETCYQMYAQMESKLAPEIMYFNMKENVEEDLLVSATDAFNLLRPETVESLMVLYRVTKDEKYREYGREIMKAFEKNCRLERGGYASIGNVAKGPIHIGFRNEMESFFIAETLKYLFLLFSDDSVLPLDKIVFNTEAHPFPIDKPAA